MSEWFKEHDWKSCVRLKRTGGSNPLLCAIKTHTKGALKLYRVCLFLCLLFDLRGFYTPFSFFVRRLSVSPNLLSYPGIAKPSNEKEFL